MSQDNWNQLIAERCSGWFWQVTPTVLSVKDKIRTIKKRNAYNDFPTRSYIPSTEQSWRYFFRCHDCWRELRGVPLDSSFAELSFDLTGCTHLALEHWQHANMGGISIDALPVFFHQSLICTGVTHVGLSAWYTATRRTHDTTEDAGWYNPQKIDTGNRNNMVNQFYQISIPNKTKCPTINFMDQDAGNFNIWILLNYLIIWKNIIWISRETRTHELMADDWFSRSSVFSWIM